MKKGKDRNRLSTLHYYNSLFPKFLDSVTHESLTPQRVVQVATLAEKLQNLSTRALYYIITWDDDVHELWDERDPDNHPDVLLDMLKEMLVKNGVAVN